MARPSAARGLHVVLLAGGSGTRFWPLSRAARPKQLLPLASRRPLLRDTWTRARKLVPATRIWVVAPAALAPQVRKTLPDLGRKRLILEPTPRDTGPAVALACRTVAAHDANGVVAMFPTDHVIADTAAFVEVVGAAVDAAREGALVCLGVRPDRPATGFGYLRTRGRPEPGRAIPVQEFVEKPDLSRARRFLQSGRYLWNAGMFVWKAERFVDEARRVAPALDREVARHLEGKPRAWSRAPRLSVDYAVMERAQGVRVVALDAGWDDVGSWDAVCRLRPDLARSGRGRLLLDSPGSAVFGGDRFVAVVGVPGVAVVDTPDALLVVAREHSEGIKQLVEQLRRRGRRDLL